MQGAILVYDVTDRTSFLNVANWFDSVTEHGSPNICVALVGHKKDLEEERSVGTQEGRKVCTVLLKMVRYCSTTVCYYWDMSVK